MGEAIRHVLAQMPNLDLPLEELDRIAIEHELGDAAYIITQGQPGRETRSAIMQIAEEGLARFNMGSSAAMSTILTLCLLLISLVMLSFTRERDAK